MSGWVVLEILERTIMSFSIFSFPGRTNILLVETGSSKAC